MSMDTGGKYKPYPAYKNSGVEWLGEVPEHWEVSYVRRYVIEHRQGFYTSESYVDSGIKLLRITDLIGDGKVSFEQCPEVRYSKDVKPFMLLKNDFVFARTGGAGLFGYIDKINEDAIYASYLIRFRFDEKFSSKFLRYFFLSDSFQKKNVKKIFMKV